MTHPLLLPWHQQPIVVWDVETTGVDPETDRIVQVAAAYFEGGKLVRAASSLANPGRDIPEAAAAVHGITAEMVADAPEPKSAIGRVCDEVLCCYTSEKAWGAAYNAGFDRDFLLRADDGLNAEQPSLNPEGPPWLDPLVVVRAFGKFWKGPGRHKLTAVCEKWGIALDNAHDAKADAIAAGRVLFSEPVLAELKNLTICEALRRQEIVRARQQAEFDAWLAKQPREEGGKSNA